MPAALFGQLGQPSGMWVRRILRGQERADGIVAGGAACKLVGRARALGPNSHRGMANVPRPILFYRVVIDLWMGEHWRSVARHQVSRPFALALDDGHGPRLRMAAGESIRDLVPWRRHSLFVVTPWMIRELIESTTIPFYYWRSLSPLEFWDGRSPRRVRVCEERIEADDRLAVLGVVVPRLMRGANGRQANEPAWQIERTRHWPLLISNAPASQE